MKKTILALSICTTLFACNNNKKADDNTTTAIDTIAVSKTITDTKPTETNTPTAELPANYKELIAGTWVRRTDGGNSTYYYNDVFVFYSGNADKLKADHREETVTEDPAVSKNKTVSVMSNYSGTYSITKDKAELVITNYDAYMKQDVQSTYKIVSLNKTEIKLVPINTTKSDVLIYKKEKN